MRHVSALVLVPVILFGAMLVVGPGPAFAQTTTCDLYPIALNVGSVQGLRQGAIVRDIHNGVQPGNFGWLTWTGDGGTQVLTVSLTPPGNSFTYINPVDPADGVVSVGDWVIGRPGVDDSSEVRAALDNLKGLEIIVPTWDAVAGTGSNSAYHVSGFALIQILDYRLPKTDRITARYLKPVSCDVPTATNLAPTAADESYHLVEVDTLFIPEPGVLANDRDPDGDPLRALW